MARLLIDSDAVLFFEDQLVKDRQNTLAIGVHLAQRFAKSFFVAARLQPFMQERSGHVDIAPQIVRRMATQKKAVEDRRFALRGQRIDVISADHIRTLLNLYRTTETRTLYPLSHQSSNAVKSPQLRQIGLPFRPLAL